ncbi:MAG: N-acetylmuramoyl-L-alanine amidase-like domain-containing protein [Candidatus Zhuqueibacterota bacterium]
MRIGRICVSLVGLSFLLFFNCSLTRPAWKNVRLSEADQDVVDLLVLDADHIRQLKSKPLFKFTPHDLDVYLGYLQSVEPDLRARVQHLARKCLGQPYEIFLLGEFPFEIYDPQPLYNLQKSDCVVFSEHIYAMALSYDWKSFFTMLQRIRYKDGHIGVTTRNHYTEFDWDVNNSWLVEDMTATFAGNRAAPVTTALDKARFFARWELGQFITVDTMKWSYIPHELLPEIIDQLQPGDFVNIVRGNEEGKWVGHVGLITKDDDGAVNFLHSTWPRVKEEPLLSMCQAAVQANEANRQFNEEVQRKNKKITEFNEALRAKQGGEKSPKEKKLLSTKPYFYGFKFLRLRNDPIWELMKIDGPLAPRVVTSPMMY